MSHIFFVLKGLHWYDSLIFDTNKKLLLLLLLLLSFYIYYLIIITSEF